MLVKNIVYEMAEFVATWEPEIKEIVIENFEENFKQIPEKYRPIIYLSLIKDLKDIPEYVEVKPRERSALNAVN